MGSSCLHLHPAQPMTNLHLPAMSPCSLNLRDWGGGCSQQHRGSILCLLVALPCSGMPHGTEMFSTLPLITAAGIILQPQPECLCSVTWNQVADAEAAELAACFSSTGSPAFAGCQASTLSLLHFLSLVCFSNILTTELIEMMFHVSCTALWVMALEDSILVNSI